MGLATLKVKIMLKKFNFKNKSFAVYGLGLTGKSVVKFLKKNRVKKNFHLG